MNWRKMWDRIDDELDETVTWRKWWMFVTFILGVAFGAMVF